jgi:uncharacterized membrane protein
MKKRRATKRRRETARDWLMVIDAMGTFLSGLAAIMNAIAQFFR